MRIPGAASTTFRSLRHHNYRLWAGADIVSVTGTWMQVLGVNWLVLSATGSATSVGLSLVLQALPTLLLGMWGGALADRLPARPVVLAAQVAQAVLAVLLAVIASGDPSSMAPVYAVALAGGVVTALGGPALGRFGAEVVPPQDLPNAMALGSVLSSAGRILGMSLAAALMPVIGTAGLFAANAATFLAVIAALLAMRTSELHALPKAEPGERGIRAALAYALRTPWLLVLLSLALVLGSIGRNYQITMAAMSAGPLGSGAAGYGVLSAVFAVGTVLGGIYAASRSKLTLPLLLGAAAVASVLQAVSGFAPGMLSFAALLLPIAAAAVVIDTAVSARVQLDSPDTMRGRVIALQGVVSAGAGALGGPVLGALSDGLGPRAALEIAGTLSTVATVVAGVVLLRYAGAGFAPVVTRLRRLAPAGGAA